MSRRQQELTEAAQIVVKGECIVHVSSLTLPIVSSDLFLLSGFVVIGLPGNRRIVSKDLINFIIAEKDSEVGHGKSHPVLSAFQIGKSTVRTSDGREIVAHNVRIEEDFIIIYMPGDRKLIIRKDLVKEIEEISMAAEENGE